MTLYLQMIRDGGPIMLVIAFCTLIAVFIFLKKYMQFYRAQVNNRRLECWLSNKSIKESIELIKNLLDSIAVLNERVVSIATSTEEISAQSESIRGLSEDIQKSVGMI